MTEDSNNTLRLGDRVTDGAVSGLVVGIVGTEEFSEGYEATDWAYLKVGVLVLTEEAGVVHYADLGALTIRD
jgi:hypothetical protein